MVALAGWLSGGKGLPQRPSPAATASLVAMRLAVVLLVLFAVALLQKGAAAAGGAEPPPPALEPGPCKPPRDIWNVTGCGKLNASCCIVLQPDCEPQSAAR